MYFAKIYVPLTVAIYPIPELEMLLVLSLSQVTGICTVQLVTGFKELILQTLLVHATLLLRPDFCAMKPLWAAQLSRSLISHLSCYMSVY